MYYYLGSDTDMNRRDTNVNRQGENKLFLNSKLQKNKNK